MNRNNLIYQRWQKIRRSALSACHFVRKRGSRVALLLCSFTTLIACTTDLAEYKPLKPSQDTPFFDIETYFSGDLIARGIVQDYAGKVTRLFCVELNGTWHSNQGVLVEKFYFNDGEISYRNWQLTNQGQGSYTGTAEDVIGVAQGKHQGFAFQFTYDLLLNVGDETYQVAMDDWMYQIDEYRVINQTVMSKFGVTVAKVSLFFDKETPHKQCR